MRKLIKGVNDLATTNPDLASEWNYEKNGDLKPDNVLSGCNKKVWWKCKEGHEWQASPNHRIRGRGCPYCSGNIPIIGETDLATVRPDLAEEWNYEKNGELKPHLILPNCGKKVWWKCKEGHEWQATPNHRISGTGCPYCSNKKVLQGFNDLATVRPDLAEEWNYEKNGDLKPNDFVPQSHTKVWWIGKCGHEWLARISDRFRGSGCPYCCSGPKKISTGFNDLATVRPDLAEEWNYEKNGDLKPSQVMINSNKLAWWKCKAYNHEWQTTPNNRNRGRGCPFCSGKGPGNHIIKGFNDLEFLNPDLASEWNYEKNGDLKPDSIALNYSKKVWWKCKEGHEWQASPNHRIKGRGCPVCSESHLEKTVEKYLIKYGYEYKSQVRFKELKIKFPLSYDFGLYEDGVLHTLIECQGIQHFEAIDFFGGKKQFERQLEHDRIKRQYCIDNNILLIEIPYTYSDEDIEEMFQR